MPTNKKEVQRRADRKRQGRRARAWTAIVWDESAKDNWQDILREQLVECLISPHHNKDLSEDGTPKKPHWHVVLSFKSPATFEKAKEVFDEIGANVPPEDKCRVRDFRQMARYLCHMDQPEKHRYDTGDVISIGAIDYYTLVMSNNDENAILDEIFSFMDEYCIETYPAMIRKMKELHPEWKSLVYRKFTYQITNYAKGIHAELKGL
jgi:hypothetical protein